MADSEPKGLEVSWSHPIQTRDGGLTNGSPTTDAKMVNCFTEVTPNGKAIVKRPGSQYLAAITATGHAQGLYFAINGANAIINDTSYAFNGAAGVPIPTVNNPNLPYTSINSELNPTPSVIQNGAGELWTTNGVSITKVTDANYTSAGVVQGIAYLDNVYYVITQFGKVLGSAINDPTTWPALDFVQADVEFGQGITVARHLNYILAFYSYGLQVYYDANSAPNGQGTALGVVSNGSFTTGAVSARCVSRLGDLTIFLAQTSLYGRSVQMLNGLTLQSISTPYVEKILNNPNVLTGTDYNLWSETLQMDGHQWYILTLANINTTLVFDLITQEWSVWTSKVSGTEQYYVGRYYVRVYNGDYMQDVSTGRPYLLEPSFYTDATGSIPVTAVTPNNDWGTMSWKRFGYMNVFADTLSTTVSVSFSDNDYGSFSTPRTVDLSTVRKQLRNCGSSRRRAWKLQHTDNTPLRVYSMTVNTTGLQR